jgi:N6-adenosine-specific RNA methylase IME4
MVCDPPWEYEAFAGYNGNPGGPPRKMVLRELPYDALTVPQLEALPVRSMADSAGANLFLWTTNRYLPAAFGLLEAWGFRYRQTLLWFKTGANPLTGAIAPTACEFLLYARIGNGAPLGSKWSSPLVTTKRPGPNSHSAKPDAFLDLIEQVSPGPYVEMFSRRARFGWDYVWHDGDPAPVTVPASVSP